MQFRDLRAVMKSCPNCTTLVEPWEVSCHNCNAPISYDSPLQVSDVAPAKVELEEAYENWLERGKKALDSEQLEEACNDLREAIKRSRALDNALDKEITARKTLAEALEKLGKLQEAADQYRIIAQETTAEDLREAWLKKSQDLVASSSSLPYELLFQKEEFRPLQNDEVKVVPLYCLGCKRLLAEAEVYGLRRGVATSVRCWCGVEGLPLAKQDAKHSRALQEAKGSQTTQRTRAIEVASKALPGGRKKHVAALLSFFLGWCGGHKFYLGETNVGFIYLVFCWTLVPFLISLYEGIVLSEMSVTTFNMTYNVELVLQLIDPPDEPPPPKMDVFSMEVGPETDDEDTRQMSATACENTPEA